MTGIITRSTFSSAIALILVALCPGSAAAEHQRLHERVPNPREESGPLVEQAAPGRNPAALRLPRYEISEPEHRAEPRPGEPTFQALDQAPSLQQLRQYRPDLQTGGTPQLPAYSNTFIPSIAPHKRTSALDRVGPDYSLSIGSPELTVLPVGGEPESSRDLFWGTVMVRLEPNQPVPIPSVSPEARILSVRARPERPIRFYRDGSGNYYVSSPEGGDTRLVFVTDAPASYFGAPLPPDVTAAEIPAAERPVLPPNVARAAAEVSRRLGLDPAAPIERNLTRLVTYLRSFRTEETQAPPGADPYITLALGRRGVCRHRAFVFVVTVQGLGLPARMVTNEVHAFAEVMVPRVGWILVDLGGEGPLRMANDPIVRHEPRSPDPFPWPPRQTPPQVAPAPSDIRSEGDPQPRDVAAGPSGETGSEGRREGAEGQEGAEDQNEPRASEQPAPQPSNQPTITLDHYTARVVRGEALTVSGRVTNTAGPVEGARVRIWLSRRGSELLFLGSTVSAPDGTFRARLAVPPTVPIGDYRIVARAEP